MSGFPYVPPQELLDLLHAHQSFWLVTHVYPDNDGFGSMLAMGRALKQAGKDVQMIYEGGGPQSFQFLPGFGDVKLVDQVDGSAEVLLIFDCHELTRIGSVAGLLKGHETIAIIDHHIAETNRVDGDMRWQLPESAATSCLVQSLIYHFEPVSLDAEMATCLYAAILTDTAGFRLANTTADTLQAAADLAAAGANPAATAEEVLHRCRAESLLLMSRVIDSVQFHGDGRIALLYARQEMLEETGGLMTETEGIVNYFTSADGVQLVALFKEEAPGSWRVSMRANAPFDIQWVASQFGGGGHRQAAGFDIEAEVEELQNLMLELFTRELESRVEAT